MKEQIILLKVSEHSSLTARLANSLILPPVQEKPFTIDNFTTNSFTFSFNKFLPISIDMTTTMNIQLFCYEETANEILYKEEFAINKLQSNMSSFTFDISKGVMKDNWFLIKLIIRIQGINEFSP